MSEELKTESVLTSEAASTSEVSKETSKVKLASKSKEIEKETTHEKVTKAQHKKDQKKPPFYWSMPWNVIREINRLGYNYTWKNILLVYLVTLAVIIGLGMAFKLKVIWLIVDIIFGILIAPKFVMNSYNNKNEAVRFSDVNTYIEQMLYAFSNSHRVLTALEDVSILYQDGPMREVIDKAIETIQNPSEDLEEDVEEIALEIIADRYPNQYVRQLHRFMLKVERVGGNFDAAIELLIQNRVNWQARTDYVISKEKKKKNEILGSCMCAVFLCLAMLYMLPSDVSIFPRTLVQVSNALLIAAAIVVYERADHKLALNIVNSKEERKLKECRKDYEKFMKYDKKEGFKQSLKWSIPPAILAVVVLIINIVKYFHNVAAYDTAYAALDSTATYALEEFMDGRPTVGVSMFIGPILLLALSVFMEFQAELGHWAQKTRLRNEIQNAFPEWMLEMSLLLQGDNVQVSIFKSLDTVRPVLQPELEKMIEGIKDHPADPEPFMNFCYAFELPNITTSMQMLYSLSIGSGGNAQKQIKNIVERNNRDMDLAERNRCENKIAGMQTLFFAPVLLASVIMMIDMTMFLSAFMGTLSVTSYVGSNGSNTQVEESVETTVEDTETEVDEIVTEGDSDDVEINEAESDDSSDWNGYDTNYGGDAYSTFRENMSN